MIQTVNPLPPSVLKENFVQIGFRYSFVTLVLLTLSLSNFSRYLS